MISNFVFHLPWAWWVDWMTWPLKASYLYHACHVQWHRHWFRGNTNTPTLMCFVPATLQKIWARNYRKFIKIWNKFYCVILTYSTGCFTFPLIGYKCTVHIWDYPVNNNHNVQLGVAKECWVAKLVLRNANFSQNCTTSNTLKEWRTLTH